MKNYFKFFCLGAVLYPLIEIVWRGHTHWTMSLLGGIIMMSFYMLNKYLQEANILIKAILGMFVITLLEFLTGLIVNVRHEMHVWSYDSVPYNILGQICPIYTFYWLILSIFAFLILERLQKREKASVDI